MSKKIKKIKEAKGIVIDNRNQVVVNGIRKEIAMLEDRLKIILVAIYNNSGKTGDYKLNDDCTELIEA